MLIISYIIHFIATTFVVFLMLTTNSVVFGSNMVFLAVYLPVETLDRANNYDKSFVLFTLMVTNILNYRTSVDNSTFCGNAIYSIVLFFITVTVGAMFFYSIFTQIFAEKLHLAPDQSIYRRNNQPVNFYKPFIVIAKFLVVIMMDLFFSSINNEWYLITCFVVFYGYTERIELWSLISLVGLPLGYVAGTWGLLDWILYSLFSVIVASLAIVELKLS